MHRPDGTIATHRDGSPRKMPYERHLGDFVCQGCPRWDRARGEPTPPVGGFERDIITMADLAFLHGLWPRGGGALDQPSELLSLLLVLRRSPWGQRRYRAHTVTLRPAVSDGAAAGSRAPILPTPTPRAGAR